MEAHAIGLNIHHVGDFVIDRPTGSGDNLLIVFKSNALVTINGVQFRTAPDNCILYRRTSKQLYQTAGDTYINHYLHFDCGDEDLLVRETGISFDTLIPFNGSTEPEKILDAISKEQMNGSIHQKEYIDMLLRMLILKLSDCSKAEYSSQENYRHTNELLELRAEIYSNPGQFNSICELAKRTNLSPSHFQQLYRSQFDISCYNDLLSAKIAMAQFNLTNTTLTVKAIGKLCGYQDDICFIHAFKKRTGITPTEYRMKKEW